MAASKKTFVTTIVKMGPLCLLPVPFDPKAVWGKARPPVTVTVGRHTYASTIAQMGNGPCLPLRKSNREAAGLVGDETVKVTLELDTSVRDVEVPADLAKALRATKGAWDRFHEMSFSHRREHVEAVLGAKRPETRARRVALTVDAVAARAPKAPPKKKLNAAWHEAHPMPKNATEAQRVSWHRAHAKACGCRPVPASLAGKV